MADLASVRVIARGHVQGVYFRAFTAKHAAELGVAGYVQNLPGGNTVEVRAEGEKDRLQRLIEQIKVGPPGAGVEEIVTDWAEYTGRYSGFGVRY